MIAPKTYRLDEMPVAMLAAEAAGKPSGLMLKARKVNRSVPVLPHW